MNVVYRNGQGLTTRSLHFVYDGQDRRIAKQVDADGNGTVDLSEHYVYDGSSLLLVLSDGGRVSQRYLQAGGQVLAEETVGSPNLTRWNLADHEGSLRDVISSAGLVLDHITYDSFGQILTQSSPTDAMRMGYTGQVQDEETGLAYYNARYYDPAVGRFLSPDPLSFGAGDGNLYRYVGNDPLNRVDPTGLCEEESQPTEDGERDRYRQYQDEESERQRLREQLAADRALLVSGNITVQDAARIQNALNRLGLTNGLEQQLLDGWGKRLSREIAQNYQQTQEENSGIRGVFNTAQRYYQNAGQQLLDQASRTDSRIQALVQGFVGQYLDTFGSMLNVPAQREARIKESDIYQQQYGLNPWYSWLLSSAERLPVLRSIVNGYEMYGGQSVSGYDLGRTLNGWDYAKKVVDMVADAATVGAVAESVTGWIKGKAAPDVASSNSGQAAERATYSESTATATWEGEGGSLAAETGQTTAPSAPSVWRAGRYSESASNPGAYQASGGRVFPTARNSGLSGDALRQEQLNFFKQGLTEGKSLSELRGQAEAAGYTRYGGNASANDRLAHPGAEARLQQAIREAGER